MTSMKCLLIALVSVGLALAAPVSKTWKALSQVKSGDPVEIITSNRAEKGLFVSVADESLTIQVHGTEERFLRGDVVRVVSRKASHRSRNVLIGVGVGAAIGLVADQTLGTYLRNESNPDTARPLIWTLPIALCGGIGALFPAHRVIYQK
jgi:TusA-related sulfurtransferase